MALEEEDIGRLCHPLGFTLKHGALYSKPPRLLISYESLDTYILTHPHIHTLGQFTIDQAQDFKILPTIMFQNTLP